MTSSIKPGTRKELIMDVLSARDRLGDRQWAFSTKLKKDLKKLETEGLITTKSGNVENTIQANITDKGREIFQSSTWNDRKFEESVRKVPVKEVISPNDRWEKAVLNDPRSKQIYDFISKYDLMFNNDSFSWKSGGDGDNGEELMYLLDEFFINKDKAGIVSHTVRPDFEKMKKVNPI